MTPDSKAAVYRSVRMQLASLLEEVHDPTSAMASVAAVLFEALSNASWVGFYRVVEPGLLRVAPYQGPLGCLEIPFGSGVCGTAAQLRQSQVVPDVHAFPGHIACDAQAQSEIVIPIYDLDGDLKAVLDIDSHQPASFDNQDLEPLEEIASLLRPHL